MHGSKNISVCLLNEQQPYEHYDSVIIITMYLVKDNSVKNRSFFTYA